MAKACVICGGEESSGEQLVEAPCQRHWVCTDDVASFFERATESESLYPPKCCGQIFLLDLYEAHVPFEVQWAFQMKEVGEYSILAKYRVYCASPTCSKFLSPIQHVKDPSTNITYAICQDNDCGKLTCISCKTLLDGVDGHVCEQNEDDKKFKQTATEKGYQECPTCGSTVELAEACNHITCECGAEFCYICGKNWRGMHGCPHYGPAIYDQDGYNQDGFHRTTGLSRMGYTRREQRRIDMEDEEDDGDDDEANEDEDENLNHPAWAVLQHVEPGVREAFAALPEDEQEMFLVNLQIRLFEDRGITFPAPGQEDDGDAENEEDGDGQDHDAAEGANNGRNNLNMNGEEGGFFEAPNAEMTAAMQPFGEMIAEEAVFGRIDHAPIVRHIENVQVPGVVEVHPRMFPHLDEIMNGLRDGDGTNEAELEVTATNPTTLVEAVREMRALMDVGDELIQSVQETMDTARLSISNITSNQVPLNSSGDNGVGQEDNDRSSSASPGEAQPSTPMDVDSPTNDGEEERPAWKGPPGGWPVDEEL